MSKKLRTVLAVMLAFILVIPGFFSEAKEISEPESESVSNDKTDTDAEHSDSQKNEENGGEKSQGIETSQDDHVDLDGKVAEENIKTQKESLDLTGKMSVEVKKTNDNMYSDGTLRYIISDGINSEKTAAVAGIAKKMKNVSDIIVPDILLLGEEKIPVTAVADEAFAGTDIESISLPDSTGSIGECAFMDCGKLTEFTIPIYCDSIGDAAFLNCKSLKYVNFEDSCCRKLGDIAFAECGLTEVVLGDWVDSIGRCCFSQCEKLESVKLGEDCSSIGAAAFMGCSSLVKITKPKANKHLKIENGCIYNADGTVLLSGWLAEGEIVIGKGVKEIAPFTFEANNRITSVTIAGSVKKLPEGCFENCKKLKTVTLKKGVKVIGENCFFGCSALKKIEIASSVKTIAENPFMQCNKLTKFIVDKNNKYFKSKNGMLVSKNGKKIIAAPGVNGDIVIYKAARSINECAFAYNSKITSLTLHENINKLGESAFYSCSSLKYVNISNRDMKLVNSEMTENGKDMAGVFRGCAENLEISVPFSIDSGKRKSIESSLNCHTDDGVIIVQY